MVTPPECALWTAVLEQAVAELVGRRRSRAERLAAAARRWLFDEAHDEDFATVCTWAGIEPTWLRARVRAALHDRGDLPTVHREEATR